MTSLIETKAVCDPLGPYEIHGAAIGGGRRDVPGGDIGAAGFGVWWIARLCSRRCTCYDWRWHADHPYAVCPRPGTVTPDRPLFAGRRHGRSAPVTIDGPVLSASVG